MLCDTFWSFLTPKSSKVPNLSSQLSLTSLLYSSLLGSVICAKTSFLTSNKTENPSKDALHKADDSINPDNPLSLDPLSLDQL